MTCVKNREIDFLISEYNRAKALRIDTMLLSKKIVGLKDIVYYQDETNKALNAMALDQGKIINTYKKDYNDLSLKYQKSEKKLSNRTKMTLVFLGTTILAGTIAIFK